MLCLPGNIISVAFSIKYSSYSNDNNKTLFYWINLHMNVTAANAIAKKRQKFLHHHQPFILFSLFEWGTQKGVFKGQWIMDQSITTLWLIYIYIYLFIY